MFGDDGEERGPLYERHSIELLGASDEAPPAEDDDEDGCDESCNAKDDFHGFTHLAPMLKWRPIYSHTSKTTNAGVGDVATTSGRSAR